MPTFVSNCGLLAEHLSFEASKRCENRHAAGDRPGGSTGADDQSLKLLTKRVRGTVSKVVFSQRSSSFGYPDIHCAEGIASDESFADFIVWPC
jgi:hypothetical protein